MRKILFLFNQMLEARFATGGDVLAREMLVRAVADSDFDCQVAAPECASGAFAGVGVWVHKLGGTVLDKYFFKHGRVATYVFAYLGRTWEFVKKYGDLRPDIVYSTGDFFCNIIPAWWLKHQSPDVKLVTCLFHINESPFGRKMPFVRGLVSFLSQRVSFYFIKRYADVIFVLTEDMRHKLTDMGFTNTIVVSGAGLDVAHVKSLVKECVHVRRTNDLVFFNRVNLTKGVLDLPQIVADVIKDHPKARLHIVGSVSDETKHRLERLFEERGCLENVRFYGFVENKRDVYRILQACKVFVQPSYEEGWGIALFEAVLCGCLPVVYELSVYHELFGDTLESVPVGDISAFSARVLKLLAWEDRRAAKLRKKLSKIASEYDWQGVYAKQKGAMVG